MNLSQRITHHRDEIEKLKKRHAERLAYVATDLELGRDNMDADSLRSHANVLEQIETKIAIERAIVQELEMLDILCVPVPVPAPVAPPAKKKRAVRTKAPGWGSP